MSLVVSPEVADLAAAAVKLRADDPAICDGDRLLGDIEVLLDTATAVQAVLARRVAAAIEVDATATITGRSMTNWLVEEQLLPAAEAGRLVRLGRYLPAVAPETDRAFMSGQISAAHASAVMTALNTLPESLRPTVEPHLVERARSHPPREIAQFTDQLLDGLGLDKASDARREQRHLSRGLDLAQTMSGVWSITGTLSPEVGSVVAAALRHATQTSTGAQDDHRNPRHRRHDALAEIANTYLAAADTPAMTGAPRAVIVTMTLETLEARLGEQTSGMLPDGIRVGPDTARRLACDAAIIPAVLGTPSEVLDIGKADHDFTTAIRRAAYLRDGGRCAFPQCRNRIRELHHIHFRRDLGPTCLDNAAWLCTFHHWLAHEGGWRLRRDAEGNYRWTSPAGRTEIRRLDDG